VSGSRVFCTPTVCRKASRISCRGGGRKRERGPAPARIARLLAGGTSGERGYKPGIVTELCGSSRDVSRITAARRSWRGGDDHSAGPAHRPLRGHRPRSPGAANCWPATVACHRERRRTATLLHWARDCEVCDRRRPRVRQWLAVACGRCARRRALRAAVPSCQRRTCAARGRA